MFLPEAVRSFSDNSFFLTLIIDGARFCVACCDSLEHRSIEFFLLAILYPIAAKFF